MPAFSVQGTLLPPRFPSDFPRICSDTRYDLCRGNLRI